MKQNLSAVRPGWVQSTEHHRQARSRRMLSSPARLTPILLLAAALTGCAATGGVSDAARSAAPMGSPSNGISTVAPTTSTVGTSGTGRSPSGRHDLPRTVDGVPMAALAAQAQTLAREWSEQHPTRARVVRSSEAAFSQLIGDGRSGTTSASFVVALDGHFQCLPPLCAGSLPATGPAPTTTPSTPSGTGVVPLNHLTFTVPVVDSNQSGSGLRVGGLDPDLSRLGHVYDLQPYLD